MALSGDEKKTLLGIARSSIAHRLEGGASPELTGHTGALAEGRGAFVTLHLRGRLRGCIGLFSSDDSLVSTVSDMALSAAFKDPRFEPLAASELGDIDIEISALTPLRKIDDPEEIEVGRHGIYIIKGYNRGVLLPQVAVENGFDRDTFLDQTCMKAGLAPGTWREQEGGEGVDIYVFEAEIFSEPG